MIISEFYNGQSNCSVLGSSSDVLAELYFAFGEVSEHICESNFPLDVGLVDSLSYLVFGVAKNRSDFKKTTLDDEVDILLNSIRERVLDLNYPSSSHHLFSSSLD